MAVDNFIPQLWAAELLENLNDDHVYGALLNRDYEGDISAFGDSVRINSIGRVTIRTHTKNSAITAPETLVGAGQSLIIDQAKYYNFEIDDVDKAQAKPSLMGEAMEEAGWGLSDTLDAFVGALLEAGVATASKLTALTGCGTGASDDDVYEALVDLGVRLTENNVPSGGRWCVVTPWFEGLLRKDPRFVSFGTGENVKALKNGSIGRAAGFDLSVSNNVPVTSTEYTIIAGHKIAGTLAEQIDEPKAYQPEDAFGDAMKGLHLYGAKVTRPNGLASVVCTAA